MNTAIVFVHGINAHLKRPLQEKAWRDALRRGGVEMAGVHSTFAYYSDWFFKEPAVAETLILNEAKTVSAEGSERVKELEAEIDRLTDKAFEHVSPEEQELLKRAAAEFLGDPTKENLSNLDISTLFPKGLVRAVIRKMVFQLYNYFDNTPVEHPVTGKKERARTLIRRLFRNAVADARKTVGEGGTVLVLAHSMGSVVAWDCLQHDKSCGDVDGLVTFGSPLGLDFVQRELAKVAGNDYRREFPARLSGNWHNLIARFDKIATLDTSFEEIFPGGEPNRLATAWLQNPDFRWSVRPSTRLSSAHSGSGYLRSRAMASALQEFGLGRKTISLEAASTHQSAKVESLAAQRYRTHELSRKKNKARLDAQKSVLGIEVDERVINQLSQSGLDHTTAAKMVSDAKANPASRVVLERVLGTPDFVQRSYALRMAAITSCVGQVLIGKATYGEPVGFGTGFLISPRLLMTNNHVLTSEATAAGSTIRFDYSKNIDDQDMPGEEYGLRPDIFFVTSPEDKLDFTIVAVDEPAGGLARPWSRLIKGSGKVLLGQSVNIIQHPRGRRQELITRNSTLSFLDEKPDYAHYSGDTEPGSSGAPCFNDRWELAFLHHASVPKTDKHGNYLKTNGQIWRSGDDQQDIEWIANEGIRISRIVHDVESRGLAPHHAQLFAECFEDPKLGRFVNFGLNASESSDFTDEASGNGQIIRRHADGRVSYLFEVSFGPYTQPQPPTRDGSAPGGFGAPAERPAPTSAPTRTQAPTVSLDTQLERSIADLVATASKGEGYYETALDAEDIEKYYQAIAHDTGEVRMFREYSQLISKTHTKVFGYDSARLKILYPYVDLHKDGTLRSIYSGEMMSAAEVIMEEAMILMERLPQARESFVSLGLDGLLALSDGIEDDLPEVETTSVPYNCEHVVPQSWYDKRKPMVSDLHHLFTCERGCNSYRGNRPYGDFEGFDPQPDQVDPIEAELRAQCGLVEELPTGALAFEPENNKGVVARATLYFLLRYQNEVGDEPKEMPLETVDTLVQWHTDQPVTDYERHRNRAIFLTQGNRNPLIDFPDLAAKLAFRESFE